MTSSREVQDTIVSTIRDVLDLDDGVLINETTTASDVPGWDSLAHVRIMLALERKFHFTWSDEEITSLKRVGDMFEIISRKLAAEK